MKESDAVIEQLDHIMSFQLSDLRKGSILATANFLVAVGCMNTIEFLGGVRNGELGQCGKVEPRFTEGVRLLGGEYAVFGEGRMYDLRNGLTHQYAPSLKGVAHIAIVNDWSDGKAIVADDDRVILNVARLVVDLGEAWGRLRCELLRDESKARLADKALSRLPKLL